MTRIRPPVRGFGPVAPGIGAAIGVGLQGVGQAVGAISDLQTNRELFGIQEQEQIDRLEQAQFEKVERSEAIVQLTAKQIARNEESERILAEAKKARNYEDVQGDMDKWEKSFDQNLFSGRSQEFQDIFLSVDRSARVSRINVLGTAVQAGNLGIIRDNYQIAADNFVESVNASSDPAEIVEFFDTHEQTGVDMGMRPDAIDVVAGVGRREAMERYVRSLLLVDGLAALSDENVAGALGEDGRETLRRDLVVKANTFRSAQELVNAAFLRTNDIDILDAFRQGEDVTALSGQIRDAEKLSPVEKKDRLDFLRVLLIAREKGPQPVDSEIVQANVVFSNGLIDRSVAEIKAIRDEISAIKGEKKRKRSQEKSKVRVLEIVSEATNTYREAVLKEEKGEFDTSDLEKLRFKLEFITEGLVVVEEVAKRGRFENFFEKLLFGPAAIMNPRPINREGAAPAADPDLRVPNAMIGEEVQRMFLGEGNYGDLPSQDQLSLEAFLVNIAIRTENSSKALPRKEANAIVQSIFSEAQKQFLTDEKGVGQDAMEEAENLTFKNSGPPATEARQRPSQSILADQIRSGFAQGFGEEAIRRVASREPDFSDEAFDRALATIGTMALSGELGVLRSELGTVSTEISITVTDPRLNDGRPTNIPTLVEGQVNIQDLVDSGQPTDEQIGIAIRRAVERQASRASLPSFESIEQAEEAAVRRHESEGRRTRR